jgi:hypothetical protein
MPVDVMRQARKNRKRSRSRRAKTRSFPREYVEECFGAENEEDGCRPFAGVGWHDSDRLLVDVTEPRGYDDRCLNGLAPSKQQDH